MTSGQKRRVIRSQMIPMMLAHARALGADVGALLRSVELPIEAASTRELEIPLHRARELAQLVADGLDDGFVGLHVATRIPRGSYGLLEFSIRSAFDVRQACQRLVRYSGLANELAIYTLEEHPPEARLGLRIEGEPLCLGRHTNELTLALIVRIMRETTERPAWAPSRIWFAHPAPPEQAELQSFFGVTAIEFGREANGLAFEASELDRTLSSSDPALSAFLDQQADALVGASPPSGDPFWERMRAAVRNSLRNGSPELGQIAAELKMSARTLQRRLQQQDTAFHKVVDDVRSELASTYLDREDLAIGEVAFLLGYSDLRAFARAFRRWSGTTPSEYRASKAR